MAATTVGEMVQQIAREWTGDYFSGSVSTAGTSLTRFRDTQRPEPTNYYVASSIYYLGTNSGTVNVGREFRVSGFDNDGGTAGLFILSGNQLGTFGSIGDQWEGHSRFPHSVKVQAINAAIRKLPEDFWRRVLDTSITTQQNVWAYELPATIQQVYRVEIQVGTQYSGPGNLAVGQLGTGFPFTDAAYANWNVRTAVGTAGTVTRVIQFSQALPYGRILRIWGKGLFGTVSSDSDILAVGDDDYDGRLTEYLKVQAAVTLFRSRNPQAPLDQVSAVNGIMLKDAIVEAERLRSELVMPFPAGMKVSPGTGGDGQYRGGLDNPVYLAGLNTPGASAS